jgi:hypothetical protein
MTEPASCKNKSKLNEILFNGINQSRYLTECPKFTDEYKYGGRKKHSYQVCKICSKNYSERMTVD